MVRLWLLVKWRAECRAVCSGRCRHVAAVQQDKPSMLLRRQVKPLQA
jgi:hypothetical protein